MITIKINGEDKSGLVEFGTIRKVDSINQKVDTLQFSITSHPGQTFAPETGSEVEMKDGSETIFRGTIYAVERATGMNGEVISEVKCKDQSYELGRLLVVEQYKNKTVTEIITHILANYAPEFSDSAADCPITISKITFDRITVNDALERLAEMTGYSWYIDEDKVIHFFEKNTEPAPFNITEGDGNYIIDSLKITDDLSQIRNRVFIKGGEIEGEERTETFDGDGSKKFFKLSNKFARLPTVLVDSVEQTVGVDFLSNEDEFDCFWDYNQQYIRFKDDTIPAAGTDNVEVSGIPLYRLIVLVEEPTSIARHGVFEYKKDDRSIQSREAGVAMAKAEIQAYKDGVVEAQFETYRTGLRSGQVIKMTIPSMGIDEDFLIQKTVYRQLTTERGIWSVELATLRTVGIIDILIKLLKTGDKLLEDEGDVVLEKTVFPIEAIKLGDAIAINTDDIPKSEGVDIGETVTAQALNYPVEFVCGPQTPDGYKRIFILDGSPLA